MPFKMLSGFAKASSEWFDVVAIVRATTVAYARRLAIRNPDVTYFVYITEAVSIPPHGTFYRGDTIFFKGVPDISKQSVADTYVKDFVNVAYFETKCPNNPKMPGQLEDVRFYKVGKGNEAGREFFDIAVIFAANIEGAGPHTPKLSIPYESTAYQVVNTARRLQDQGIVVLLGILNNWQSAFWSCFSKDDPEAIKGARDFADQCVKAIKEYGLDGIDIDDEFYPKGATRHEESLVIAAGAIREALANDAELKNQNIIISKALCRNGQCDDIGGNPSPFPCFNAFKAEWKGKKLAQHLTYGWEMRYQQNTVQEGADHRLRPYTEVGFNKNQLILGVSNEVSGNRTRPEFVGPWAQEVKKLGYAGMMLFQAEAPKNANGGATAYVKDIARAFYNEDAGFFGFPRPECRDQ